MQALAIFKDLHEGMSEAERGVLEQCFASGAAQCLRCPSSSNLKPLLQSTSSTALAKDSVPSAGAKNSGKSTNDCSRPLF